MPESDPVIQSSDGEGFTSDDGPTPGTLTFECNICGVLNDVLASDLQREYSSCGGCGSTPRWRGVIAALSSRMFGRSLVIDRFPPNAARLRGLGMSDWAGYSERLARSTSYVNTFFDHDPRLDITEQLAPERVGAFDFVISSDVMEHVPPPVGVGLRNVRELLSPGGVFILTVPYQATGETVEHFSEAVTFDLIDVHGAPRLRTTTADGTVAEHGDLVFHGGDGFTLEMRVFALPSLLADLAAAGFVDTRVHAEPRFEHGIFWPEPWSLPISAIAS